MKRGGKWMKKAQKASEGLGKPLSMEDKERHKSGRPPKLSDPSSMYPLSIHPSIHLSIYLSIYIYMYMWGASLYLLFKHELGHPPTMENHHFIDSKPKR